MELETFRQSEQLNYFSFFQLIHLIIKLVTDIKNYLQNKSQYKDKSISHKIHIFSCIIMLVKHIDIYIDLFSITFIYSVLLHDTYHQIVKSMLQRICNKYFEITVLSF